MVPITSGKSLIVVPQNQVIPERWYITIEGYDASKDKNVLEEIKVRQETYDSIEIGDTCVYE